MGLFGKKDGDVPPDVGQEDSGDSTGGVGSGGAGEDSKSEMPELGGGDKLPSVSPGGGTVNNFQLEKIETRLDSVVEWIKQFYERFSYVSESIGEIRTMNLANEKKISSAMMDAERVIDIVKEIKPEELRANYQKSEMKMATLAEKIEANNQFMSEIMNEMNELRRKSEVFIGTEGIMKLNEDTKKELIGVQRLASMTKMQADKAQEIFMELRKGFAESQKVSAIMNNLDDSYSGLKNSIEGLKIDYSKVVSSSDYEDFRKNYDNKLLAFKNNVTEVESMKQVVSEMQDLVETSLTVSRRNEEDISKIAIKVGAEDVQGISHYENQVVELVEIIDTLSGQVAEMRKKIGMKPAKVKAVKKTAAALKSTAKSAKSSTDDKKLSSDEAPGAEAKVLKPSESEDVVKKLEEIKVPEVPELKPKEFLGKKNYLVDTIEASEERARAKVEPIDKKIAETTQAIVADESEGLPKAKGLFSKKIGSILRKVGKKQAMGLPELEVKEGVKKKVSHAEKKHPKKKSSKKKHSKKKSKAGISEKKHPKKKSSKKKHSKKKATIDLPKLNLSSSKLHKK
ncbi:MAG: hypothetical protein OEL87_02630 [Nanoarchaeota archaeon]|nr:hypothetical protein [Nanoarchaeota archaeon]